MSNLPKVTSRGATISQCQEYRYSLTRSWNRRKPMLRMVMLNPSTADWSLDDPTIRRCLTLAARQDCGSLQVVNLYALRATQPATLLKHKDPVGPDNLRWLAKLKDPDSYGVEAGPVVAAWGAHTSVPTGVGRVAEALLGLEMLCLGTTKAGHPRHPLYLPDATPLEPFPFDTYALRQMR
jgi:hypothetical protein